MLPLFPLSLFPVEAIAKTVVIVWSVACVIGCVAGLHAFSQVVPMGGIVMFWAAGLGIFFWFFLWAMVVVPVALVGLLFRKQK